VAERFRQDFRRFFLRGLAAMLPPLLTVIIVVYVLRFVDQYIGRYVDQVAQWIVVQALALQRGQGATFRGPAAIWQELETKVWQPYHLRWVSFLLAFVLIYVFGRFVASIIGRGLWQMIERAFFRLPVVKQIYPSVKQVTDFLLTERKMEFSRVVAVEYPRKGVWSVGLVTSEGMRTLLDALGDDMVTVFIPSSPTPVTGYTITVRRHEIVDLPLSIDDALRFTVSGGVIMPPGQALTQAEVEQIRRGEFLPRESKKEIPA
jgi:uncharacterized membrane protein